MKKSFPIFFFISTVILLSLVFRSNKDATPNEAPQDKDGKIATKILAVKLPDTVTFAGEPVPIKIFDVKERLDRELLVNTYWHSNTLQLFKLASRWFPTIDQILEEQCVPQDFKYMALAESGLRNDVVSAASAVGIWQILKGTGKEYGLEINRVVDERYDIEKSTIATCKYLKESHDKLGSWTLAAASYNIGKYRLKKLLKEQEVSNYYDLYLNDETARYVFRIIALKEIFRDPKQYGFYLKPEDLYEPIPYRVIEVNKSIENLPDFAIDLCTNYKMLKLLNPWLRQPYLRDRSGKTYYIKYPVNS